MDDQKVKVILDWPPPIEMTDLRSILGLANYYRKFIRGFLKRVNPLTDFLKKDQKWCWTDACQEPIN